MVDPDDDRADASVVPGDAIDGRRLSRAIRYAARVTPKEDDLVFTADDEGHPLVSGHDRTRCHTAFLPLKSAFHLDAAVPVDEALRLADALDGLQGPMVRLGANGLVIIRHGTGQPCMQFKIGSRDIVLAWEPPSQGGHAAAVGALRIQAAWQAAACRWSKAIVHTWQAASGIEWCTLTDEKSGELLARAVLAEDGRDLYPEDSRQTEIPGSRTVGMGGGGVGVGRAVDGLRDTLREHGATMTATVGGRSVTVGGAAPQASTEADDGEATVLVDGKPVAAADPAPEVPADGAAPLDDAPDGGTVWIAQIAWDDLSPEAAMDVTALVEPGSLTSEGTPGWVTAEVASVARRTLVKVAGDHDLTLHWGDAAPRTNAGEAEVEPPADLTVWVREADWDALSSGSYNELTKLVGEDGLGGTAGWISVAVPGAKGAAFRTLALRLKLPFEEGEVPPGGTAPAADVEPEPELDEDDDDGGND